MDKKAKKIIFSTYWKNGWKDDYTVSDDDFAYAKDKGFMFAPLTISHDECIQSIHSSVMAISKKDIAKAFLASLSTRHLEWRSAISSFVIAQKIPPHSYQSAISGTSYSGNEESQHHTCGICRDCFYGVIGDKEYKNEDLNVLNFERLKWGGVRHGEILYTYFDLREFLRADISEPTTDDISCFKEILSIIETANDDDYPDSLSKRLAPALKSNKSERDILIEILASIGILEPKTHDRPERGKHDWVYVTHWRGEDGYSRKAVQDYFGSYL